jgi:hypothetical protein
MNRYLNAVTIRIIDKSQPASGMGCWLRRDKLKKEMNDESHYFYKIRFSRSFTASKC